MIDMSDYRNFFTKPSFESFTNYINGLTIQMRSFSVKGLSEILGVSYDKQDWFISRGKWDEKLVNHARLFKDVKALKNAKVNFIVDESAIRKYTTKPFYVGRGYIGNIGKVDNCLSCVFSSLSDGNEVIPGDFEVYLPKAIGKEFRSKLELAITLINQGCLMTKQLGIEIQPVCRQAGMYYLFCGLAQGGY